ncbi:radical SAM protein [Haloimpatiens sp. FM7330]|uniref:radical SAM protein n=1 Tax=Haloimpatiens sp. FM7330 TaxID=3298610 RepID=UPI0036324FC7
MQIENNNTQIDLVLEKAKKGNGLSRDEALFLLKEIPTSGEKFELLLHTADYLSRKQFQNTGEVHAQIGLNWDKCQNNCQFCMFSEELHKIKQSKCLSEEEVVKRAIEFEEKGVGSISLMSTADYDFDKYLKMGKLVSENLKNRTPLFANWGDIDFEQAKAIKRAGFTYYYHALRLREGVVTKIDPSKRIETIKNAHEAGLLVGSCLEPIGPEHTYEEMVDLLVIMRDLKISWMATMKRINVEGSPLQKYGEITDEEFAKITAVTRLFYGKTIFTMAAHEPLAINLRAGANFLVAEMGTNPRDKNVETLDSRGWDVDSCTKFLEQHDYKVYKGSVNKRYLKMSYINENFTHLERLLLNCNAE